MLEITAHDSPIGGKLLVAGIRIGYAVGKILFYVSRKSKEALNSLTERKSRLAFITKLPRKGAKETRDAVLRRLKDLPEHGRDMKVSIFQKMKMGWLFMPSGSNF